MTEYGWRMKKAAKSKTVNETESKLSDALNYRCRIYFPTRDTVAASKGGIGVSEQPSHLNEMRFDIILI